MRIGIVLPEAPKYSETFFNSKIKNLSESGFEVIVFSGVRNNKEHSFKNVSAYPVYRGRYFKQAVSFMYIIFKTFLIAPARALKLISKEREDGKNIADAFKILFLNAHIIHYNLDWLHFGYATMALKRENVAKVMGARAGVSFRGYDINIYPLKHPGCYEKLWKNIDKVHSISEYLYRKALKLGLSENTSYEKITPAIDVSLFQFKEDAGKIKNPLQILTVGRLNWIKNYETAISVMKKLEERGVNFIYNIIGSGDELERLKFAVYQEKLEDKIIFHGQMKHENINKIMDESDIYLQTSYQEGFCVSVLEAQAKGLLCVVSDADGLKENIIDNVTGWIAEKRNPEDYVNKIINIIEMKDEERMEVALTARKRIEKDFRIEDQKEKFIKFFEN